jgi:hypothetical protein
MATAVADSAPDIADTIPPDVLADSGVTLNARRIVRRKPGPKPGSARRPGVKRAAAPGMKAPTMPRKAPAQDYRPAILGLLQLPQLALGLAAKFAKSERTRVALTLDGHGDRRSRAEHRGGVEHDRPV